MSFRGGIFSGKWLWSSVSQTAGVRPTICPGELDGSEPDRAGPLLHTYWMADENDRLACKAFQTVFQRQQTRHGALLAWLTIAYSSVRVSDPSERQLLEEASTWHLR